MDLVIGAALTQSRSSFSDDDILRSEPLDPLMTNIVDIRDLLA